HHSKVASLRLQEVAEWTEANAQAINIIFETAAQEHPAAQDFLQHLNDGQNLTLVERASQIRDWMYQNRGALATVEDLDLCRLSLTYLPPEIGLFQGLRTLNLSHNQLTELPAQIGNLRMLVILCLNNNQLRERPRGFENRSQLMIYLKGNPFIRNRGTKRRQETEK
ncbi:MAG TPA: hypothetical protein VLG76_04285, partial [Rhabdochlamydiaceae bacterium]|nr:hypothetical protein [Rhabdochlamydiaceae bacterium]